MSKKVGFTLMIFLFCGCFADAQVIIRSDRADTTIYFIDGQKVIPDFIHKGIFSITGTIAIGSMPENNITNAYLTGDLEYYVENKISFRGDIYYFLNSLSQNSPLTKNDALYFGAFYHLPTHSHFDPILGLQPGISYTQLNIDGTPDEATICPLASAVVGFNFFAEKWFHIEVNVRYAIGEHLTNLDETNISELSFNFGLGFNWNVLAIHAR